MRRLLAFNARLAFEIALVILIGFLPVSAILWWNAYTAYQNTFAKAGQLQTRITESTGKRLQDELRGTSALLAALATQPKVRSDDPRACSGFLTRMAQPFTGIYTLFSRTDTRGVVTCSSLGAKPVIVGLTPNIRAALHGRLGIGPARLGPQSGELIIPLSEPLRDARGRIIGTVTAGLRIDWLRSLLTHPYPGIRERAWLLRAVPGALSSGAQAASKHTPGKAGALLLALPQVPLPRCSGGYPVSGATKICQADKGRHMLAVTEIAVNFGKTTGLRLHLLMARPLGPVLAKARVLALTTAVAGFGALLLSLLLALGFAYRRLYRPLRVIGNLVHRLTTGDYAARLSRKWLTVRRQNEIERLGAQINDLAGSLEQTRAQLQTERDQLAEIAERDPLTGLRNRRGLDAELDKATARAQRHQRLLALCLIDLDGFKPVNDTYGHDAGDAILRRIGQRLEAGLRKTDFVSRLGGDEFVVLLEDLRDKKQLEPMLENITALVREPIPLPAGASVQVDLSMGVCLYPSGACGNDHAGLLRHADLALYECKAHKHDRLSSWMLYGETLEVQPDPYRQLLAREAVEVWYQPILDNRRRCVVGIEALARLRDGERIIAPGEFLPHLHDEDLYRLCHHVLDRLLRDLQTLDAQGHRLWGGFNVDPRSSLNQHCLNDIQALITRHGISPQRVHLEILEGSELLDASGASYWDILQSLHGLGVRLALDDVGSGYSSLQRLKDAPIDVIKLDQGFVRGLERNPKDLIFTQAILGLAQELGVELIVEGVETRAIWDALSVLGVTYLQGYAIAKPMPFAALRDFLDYADFAPPPCPETLLGLYAEHMMHHRLWPQIIEREPHLAEYMSALDARHCHVQTSLRRLGYGEDSPLDKLHVDYHRELAHVLSAHGLRDWQGLDAISLKLAQAVVEAWREQRASA